MSDTDPSVIYWNEDLQKRYRRSRVTIHRMIIGGKLPKPDVVIAGRNGWYFSTLVSFEQASAAGKAS